MSQTSLGISREEWKGNSGSGFVSRVACALSLALLLALGTYAQQPDQQAQQQQDQQQNQQQSQAPPPEASAPPPQDQPTPPAQGQTQDQPPPPAASAPQDQPPPPAASSPQDQPPPPQTQDQAPPPAKKPKYAPQDANRPPYASDYPAPKAGTPAHAPSPDQYDPDKDLPPGEQGAPNGTNGPADENAPNGGPDEGNGPDGPPPNRPYNDNGYGAPNRAPYGNPNGAYGRPQNAPYSRNAAPATPPPATLTIPAGTVVSVRVNEYLSSDRNQVGDRVTATLQQPVVVNGYVVARRGQMLVGQVEAAEKAGRIKGTSQLGIELTDMTMADGQSRPILTELWKGSGGTSHGADAATIGGTTALGAAIGSVADWGRGAAIGAGAGAAAGIGAVLLTRGRPTVIPPETWLTFRLKEAVTVDTTQSARAFLPVSQYDYDNYGGRRGSRYSGGYAQQGPYAQGPYAPAPNACGYDAPCYPPPAYAYPYGGYPYAGYYGYPAVSFGYYGGYGGYGYYGRGRRW
jgi:hypothetical protein